MGKLPSKFQKHLMKEIWQNSFKGLNNNFIQEKLWNVRHFILNQVDAIHHLSQNSHPPPTSFCKYCTDVKSGNEKETHLHALFSCPQAATVWKYPPLIKRISNINPTLNVIILGLPKSNQICKHLQ
jgi:hypothetical protein